MLRLCLGYGCRLLLVFVWFCVVLLRALWLCGFSGLGGFYSLVVFIWWLLVMIVGCFGCL